MKWIALRTGVAPDVVAAPAPPRGVRIVARAMRGPLLTAICLLLAARPSFGQFQITSLDDALKIGLERNLSLQQSAKQVAAAQAGVDRTTWLFLPKASIDVAPGRQQAAFDLPPGLGLALAKDPGFFFGYRNQWYTRFHVEQPLFTGGRNQNSLRIARLQADVARESQTMRRLDLEVDIARAYYGVLLAQQVVKIKEDLVAQNKRHQEDVTRRFEAGDVARFDKLRAEVQMANVLPELIRAKNNVEVATAQLRNVLDVPRDQPLAVTGSIEYTPENVGKADPFAQALDLRPEVRIGRLNRQISERTVSLSHSRWLPSVGAFFTQDYRSDTVGTLFGDRHSNWAYGLSFGFLLDVGESLYGSRQEQRQVEVRQLAEEQVRRNIEVEVTQAVLELKRAAEVIESQKQNVRQAEEAMQIANTSYANGTITNLELMDTELALDQARTNYITAVYDYLIGRAQYRRAVAEQAPGIGDQTGGSKAGRQAARKQLP